MFYLYCIENTINGKMYIGKSTNPKNRWTIHKSVARGGVEIYKDSFSYIHKALNKYGIENFHLFIFAAYDTEYECFRQEEYWISYLRESGVKLYNLSDGGEGPSGMVHSEKSKKMMSQNHAYRYGKDHPLYGIGHSVETKRLMSELAIKSGKSIGSNNPQFGKTGEQSTRFGCLGDKHPNTKISDKDMILLRIDLKSGNYTQRQLAFKYEVSEALISNIKHGKRRQK